MENTGRELGIMETEKSSTTTAIFKPDKKICCPLYGMLGSRREGSWSGLVASYKVSREKLIWGLGRCRHSQVLIE
jgi:hypothetical protein